MNQASHPASYPVSVAVFVLSVHADYACRHSGACCTAGWRIPVEPACEDRLVQSGQARRVGSNEAPLFERDEMLTVLALARDGACSCFEPATSGRASQCRIQGALGHDALPSACRHFPRVAVTDETGTYVTLSHFCPTAAAMLFRHNTELAVVEAPASFHSVVEYEGLDARGVLPPLLRPGMLMDLDAHHAWERHAVRIFGSDAHTPESALEQLAADAREITAWQPGDGSLAARLAVLSLESGPAAVPTTDQGRWAGLHPGGSAAELHEMVRACVPPGLGANQAPSDLDRTDVELVEPGWRAFATPIKRYLAAKAFASRIPWQGRGVQTTLGALRTARAVLRVEAGRQCATSARVLDRGLLIEAIRRTDLLLVHQVSEHTMVNRLAALERNDRGLKPATSTRRASERALDREHFPEQVAMASIPLDSKGLVVPCPACGKQNRLAFDQLDRPHRCAACKADIGSPDAPVDVRSTELFDAIVAHASVPVVVDYWAPWCGPCRMVAPELEKVARRSAGRLLVIKVNTDEVPELGERYTIRSIPTMAVFHQRVEVGRTSGARPAPAIEAFVNESVGVRP